MRESESVPPDRAATARRRRCLAVVAVLLTTSVAVGPVSAPPAAAQVAPDVGPYTTVRQFLTQQFEDFVGRGPGNRDLGTFVTPLRTGELTTADAFERIAARRSTAALSASIVRMYKAHLDRLPDVGGWRNWLALRRAGFSALGMAENFGSSPEFTTRYAGLDDEAFVRLVYRNVLRRAPDAGGLAFWTDQLAAGQSRAWVMVGFADSTEHESRTARRSAAFLAYAAMLGRSPTSTEQSVISDEDRAPTLGELAVRILGSTEYADLHPRTYATTYQGNERHDGRQEAPLAAKPRERWRATFDDVVGYPVVADGRVFVVARSQPGSVHGGRLYALDSEDGSVLWGPVAIGGSSWRIGIAYDDAHVYAVNGSGLLRAFDAATGDVAWSTTLVGQWSFTSPPTAVDGTVYVGGAGMDGTIYAVDGTTGALRWNAHVSGGDQSAPAIADGGVFVSYGCLWVHRLDAATGSEDWTHTTGCTSGGGRTPVVHDGEVWVRDTFTQPDLVLSTTTGLEERTFFASPAPAFHGSVAFLGFVGGNGRTLQAADAETGEAFWSSTGDGQFTTAPLSVGNRVYMGSGSGWVFAFDETTGQQLWAANAGHPIDSPDEHNASEPLVGLGSGDGLLLVPAGNDLVAYG